MNDEDIDIPSHSKKKLEENLTVSLDKNKMDAKKSDKSDGDDFKPRIVLTFRSEKSGSKNSNMKIVSSEEKHEEFSPRRSSRTRNKWEWTEDNETSTSPKKDKSTSQSVSENDEASDSSHTTPKRSTRRRSKDSSDNVLANAIARKEKSYNETTSTPTQRLSRRIKPTAKILANEELRIGLESQNNARLGIQPEKPEEGVRTRRSARPAASDMVQCTEKSKSDQSGKCEENKDDDSNVMKLKHLCELGLKAISTNSVDEDQDIEIREPEDNDVEVIEDEDEEIDDDSEVISKLLEADDETGSEGSDEDFYCSEEPSQTEQRSTRRSRRLNSFYGYNDSDKSSPTPADDKSGPTTRRSSRRTTRAYNDDSDREYMPRRKRNRPSRGEEPQCDEVEHEENSNPAGGDEGSEAACPDDDSTIIATCYCEQPSNVHAAPSELTEPVFCQAIEVVDGVRVGCSHVARRAAAGTRALSAMLRAGPRAPYLLACAQHAQQLRKHMCCPACGMFCTQGIFYQCSEQHLFHLECGLPYGESKAKVGCPHCGVHSYRWQPANRDVYKVHLDMHCSNKRIFLPEQREQCTPAYLSFSPLEPSQIAQEPLIPEDLLPLSSLDLKSISEQSQDVECDETGESPAQRLCDAILAGETVEQLVPKVVACIGCVCVRLRAGDTCAHAAARAGAAGALPLLQWAGADLDAVDAAGHTPLMLAVLALLDKKDEQPKEEKQESTEDMEVEEDKEAKEKKEGQEEKEDVKEDDKEDNKEEKESIQDVKRNEPSDEDLLKVIKYLVAAGCDVNFPGPEGLTALHMCCAAGGAGGAAAARALLAAPRLEVDARDAGGWTPLVWAAEHGHANLLRLMVEAGADPEVCDAEGNAAVHWCALGGRPAALLQLLHAAPAALSAANHHADTPLHVAARQGHYACVVILLARGAQADARNSAGETPLDVCGEHARVRSALALHAHLARGTRAPRPSGLLLSDISRGREYYPVPCINEVDDAPPPDGFTYVTCHVTPVNVSVDCTIPTMQGCGCEKGSCADDSCACCVLGVRRWYSADGRLQPAFPYHEPPMLFECNQTCACDMRQCGNSVVTRLCSRGSLGVRAAVFRCGGGAGGGTGGGTGGGSRGWGLRARQPVSRGTAVAVYCGELLPLPLADTRSADQYMFALDVKPDLLEQCADKTPLCVDAMRYGSAARFINHSCRPNLAPVRVHTSVRDLRLPTIALFATRDIQPDEELTFDYGDKFWSVKSKWMKCECGSAECRYPEITKDEVEA